MPEIKTTLPDDLHAIENFSAYGMCPDGNVYRVRPPSRGAYAGKVGVVRPVCHPRGHRWYVQLTDDDGKRHRLPLADLQLDVRGLKTIS
jgi:hypothetical protein